MIISGLLAVAVILGFAARQSNVLSEKTLLAKDDDSGGSNSGNSGSGSSGSGGSSSGSNNSNDNDEREGDDNDNGGSSGSSNTGSSNTGSSGSSRGNTGSSVIEDDEKEDEAEEVEDEDEDEIEEETEDKVELPDEPIEVITKDDRTRINITANGIKVRLERRADRVIIKAEKEDGTEVELEDDTLFKIDDRLAKSGIKVETAGENEFVIQRGNAAAITDFPVSLDLATNSLIITTPAGQKTVAILPDAAIQNLLAVNIVDRLGPQPLQNEAVEGALPSVNQLIQLGEQNGIPVYEVNGLSDQKLLGIIPVTIEKQVTISAESGATVGTSESFINQVLDLLSF